MVSTEVGAIHATLAVQSQEWRKGLEQASQSAKQFEQATVKQFDGIQRQVAETMAGAAAELKQVAVALKQVVSEFKSGMGEAVAAIRGLAAESKKSNNEMAAAVRESTKTATEAVKLAASAQKAQFKSLSDEEKVRLAEQLAAVRSSARQQTDEAKKAARERARAEREAAKESQDAVRDSAREQQKAERQKEQETKRSARERAQAEKQAAAEATAATKKAADEMKQHLEKLRDTARDLGRAFIAASVGMAGALGASGKVFLDFEAALRNANVAAKLTDDELKGVSETLLQMPGKERITQGPTALATALRDIAGSGFEGAQGLEILRIAAKGADAGTTTVAIAADGLTSTLLGLGLQAEESGRVMDVMFRAVDQGKIEFAELAQNIGDVTPTARLAGVSLEEVFGALTALSLKGIKPAEGVTALNGAILKLANPSKHAREKMAELGLQMDATKLRAVGLVAAIREVYEKTGGNIGLLDAIVEDNRALKAVAALGVDSAKDFSDSVASARNATGALASAQQEQLKAIKQQWKVALAEMEAAAIKMGGVFAPLLSKAAQGIEMVSNAFVGLSPQMQKATGIAAGTTAGMAALSGGLLLLAPNIKVVVDAWRAFAAWAPAASAALTGMAGPLAIGVAAVGALGLAWSQNWFGIRDVTQEVVEWMTPYVQQGLQAVRTGFFRLVEELKPIGRELVSTFQTVWSDVREVAVEAWEFLGPYVPGALEAIRDAIVVALQAIQVAWSFTWNALQGTVGVAWGVIQGTVGPSLALLRGMVQTTMALLQGDWKGAWDAVSRAASDAWTSLTTGWGNALNSMLTAVANLAGDFYNAGARLIEAFTAGLSQEVRVDAQGGQPGISALNRGGYDTQGASGSSWSSPKPRSKTQAPWTPPVLGGGSRKPKAHAQTIGEYVRDVQRQSYPDATITDTFNSPRYRTTGPGIHAGDDIGMPRGERALAAFPGKVENIVDIPSGDGGGMGVWIRMANGWLAKYTHLTGLVVKIGDEIRESQDLGNIYRDHLDFKLQDASGRYINIDREKVAPFKRGVSASERIQSDNEKSQARYDKFVMGDEDEFTKKRIEIKKTLDAILADQNMSEARRLEAQRSYAQQRAHIDQESSQATLSFFQQYIQRNDEIAEAGVAPIRKEMEERKAAAEYLEGIEQKRHEDAMADLEFRRQMGEVSNEQYREGLAGEVNTFVGHMDQMREVQLQYSQEFQGHLEEQRGLMGEEYLTWLQQQEAAIIALGTLSNAKQIELNGIRRAIHVEEKARIEEHRQMLIQAAESVRGSFEAFLENVLTGQRSFKDAFTGLWQEIKGQVIRHVTQMILKVLALQKLMQAAFGFLGGLFAPAIGVGGTDILSTVGDFGVAHTGGRVIPGGIATFHDGGMAGFRLRPDEVLAKLQVGEIILNEGQQRRVATAMADGHAEQPGMSMRGGVTVQVAQLVVREEADVDRVADELYRRAERAHWER